MENRKRGKSKIIRFTEEELEFVVNKISVSRAKDFQTFALHMLIQGEVKTVDYSSLIQLVGEVRKIGNNINQVVKLAHQFSEISETDIQNLQSTMNDLTRLVELTLSEEIKTENTF